LIVRAATHGSEKVFHQLLESMHNARAPAAVRDSRGTPLIILLSSLANPVRPDRAKFERMIQKLIQEFPASVNDHDRAYVGDGRTALHEAAALGNMKVMNELVTHGALVSEKNSTGETPLHLSARFGRIDAVKYLLAHGATINSKSRYTGATPLMYAAEMGHESVIRTLLDAGAEKSIKDTFGKTAPERFREYVASYQTSKKTTLR
jgi:ankyrin repeat protein